MNLCVEWYSGFLCCLCGCFTCGYEDDGGLMQQAFFTKELFILTKYSVILKKTCCTSKKDIQVKQVFVNTKTLQINLKQMKCSSCLRLNEAVFL